MGNLLCSFCDEEGRGGEGVCFMCSGVGELERNWRGTGEELERNWRGTGGIAWNSQD